MPVPSAEKDVLMSNFYETCAIVGSSGIVLNYEDGVEIDAHDMVFRYIHYPPSAVSNI